MERLDTNTLLTLHNKAYQLLLYIDRKATDDPQWLSPRATGTLSSGRSAAKWVTEHRKELPAQHLPRRQDEESFANLLASFFKTSFRVEHMELDDQLLSAELRRKRKKAKNEWHCISYVVALALKHALASGGIRLDLAESRRLADMPELKTETRLVAYIWELQQRARGKGKGPVVHSLWLSLPIETRKCLNQDIVQTARETIRQAAMGITALETRSTKRRRRNRIGKAESTVP